MATKPDSDATWGASAPPAQMATKTQLDAFRTVGWPKRFTQATGLMNRVLKELYSWVNWLATYTDVYPTLEAMIDAIPVGQIGVVAGDDFDALWAIVETITTGLGVPHGIDVDGEYVYIAAGTTVVDRRPRSDLGTVDVNYAANLSGTPTAFVGIASDGTHVAVGYTTSGDDVVDVFNATTGALIGSFDCGGATVSTVRMMGGFTFIAYGNNVSRVANTTPATATHTYDHSAVVTSLHVTRRVVIVVGAGRSTTVGNLTTGDDVVGLSFVLGGSWGVSLTNGPNSDNQDAIDGEFVYLVDGAHATAREIAVVSIYGDFVPGVGDQYAFTSTELATHAEGVAVDDRWMYVVAASDLLIYDKRTLAQVASLAITGDGDGVVASDGDRVFVLGTSSGPAYFLRSIQIPHTARRYYRVDPTNSALPYQQKAIPLGA